MRKLFGKLARVGLSATSVFITRRTVLRWVLNYLLAYARKARTDEQRAALMKDIKAVHTTTGHLVTALEDWKLTNVELRDLERDFDTLTVELLT